MQSIRPPPSDHHIGLTDWSYFAVNFELPQIAKAVRRQLVKLQTEGKRYVLWETMVINTKTFMVWDGPKGNEAINSVDGYD